MVLAGSDCLHVISDCFDSFLRDLHAFARRGAGVHNMVWHGDQCKKNFLARNWQGSKEKGKHSSTRSEDKCLTSQNARHQWRVPVPRLLEHGEWWHERHKRGSTWKSESGTWPNQKPPADARTFCRTLRTKRNRRLPVLGSPHWMVAEWVGGFAKNVGTSA